MSKPDQVVLTLDVFRCPLGGISLIEASAGTGKTWNICALYLRLLLEQELNVQEILVVTFTNAAAAELRDRIRGRLLGARDWLCSAIGPAERDRGVCIPDELAAQGSIQHDSAGMDSTRAASTRVALAVAGDPFFTDLFAALADRPDFDSGPDFEPESMYRRIELALASFDEAAIYTIHGYCQRALADTPLSAQMPLATELLHDDRELVQEVVNDFWRRRVADGSLEPALLATLLHNKDSPEKYSKIVQRHLARPTARICWPADIDTAESIDLQAFDSRYAIARELWLSAKAGIRELLDQALTDKVLNGRSYSASTLDLAFEAWNQLLASGAVNDCLQVAADDKAGRLGVDFLNAKLNKGKSAPEHPFFEVAQDLLDMKQTQQASLDIARLRLLRELIEEAGQAQLQRKRERRVVSFNDMLANLQQRLTDNPDAVQAQGDGQGDGQSDSQGHGRAHAHAPGRALAQALRERYPAALIDEFQDTDPLQFDIFESIYGDGQHPFFMVGDPKQAIYSFRNADLHTYLTARSRASGRYTIGENQRSCPALIEAVNALFSINERAFMMDGLDFTPVGVGRRPRDVLLDQSGGSTAAMQIWSLSASMLPDGASSDEAFGKPPDTVLMRPISYQQALQRSAGSTAAEIARLIESGNRDEIRLDKAPLQAGDIAVLVRSHAHGALMRTGLAALGIGSVELSQASVYRSAEAEELGRVLAAILEPAREPLVRSALATELLGIGAGDLNELAGQESALYCWMQRLANYRELWWSRGAGMALRRWLTDCGVAEQLLVCANGERRLTNLLHLIECLHQAEAAHPSAESLLGWYHQQCREEDANEASQLRLESDQNLVQIVTVHKAKGLEYPIVFCPFLWSTGAAGVRDEGDAAEYHDAAEAGIVIDYRKGFPGEFDAEEVKHQQKLERAAEDLRLMYVALTRAVHRCVLVAGTYGAGKTLTTTKSVRSLLNWLVAGDGCLPDDWFTNKSRPEVITAAWQQLAADHPGAVTLQPMPPDEAAPVVAGSTDAMRIEPLVPSGHIPPGWWIGSYSALAHGATHERAAADHDLRAVVAPHLETDSADVQSAGDSVAAVKPAIAGYDQAAGMALEQATDHTTRKAADQDVEPATRQADAAWDATPRASHDILDFPRGAGAGDCLHAVFETIDFTREASWLPALARPLRRLDPGMPAGGDGRSMLSDMVMGMLQDVLNTPLPVGTAQPLVLAQLPLTRRLNELEFHLPVERLRATTLNRVLMESGYPSPTLDFPPLQGFFKGFMDLVLEHEGRWFVLDWKSNHLGDRPGSYAPASLAQAMASNHYNLQSLMYSVALDCFLRQRLEGYRPEEHFGGALYLFVRGVRPGWRTDDGWPTGVVRSRPDQQLIKKVGALFDAREVAPS